MNLKHRSEEAEIMDDLTIGGQSMDQTLRELAVINRLLGGNAISVRLFEHCLRHEPVTTVADLGCGGGDLMVLMAKHAQSRNQPVDFIGIDANPHAITFATKNTAAWPNISYQIRDIFSEAFQHSSFDIIHCCLFLHHFTEAQLIELFHTFHTQAKVAIIINDLHRHWMAYHSIGIITRCFSRSHLVKNDAKLSVARGFKRAELKTILKQAGIREYRLKWKWAFRWQLYIPTQRTVTE